MELPQRIHFLLDKVQQQTASQAEYDELLGMIRADDNGSVTALISRYHRDQLAMRSSERKPAPINWTAAAAEVLQVTKPEAPVKRMPVRRNWWAAASLLLLLAAGGYFFFTSRNNTKPLPAELVQQHEIMPGKEGAVLTLADGRQIVLDSLGSGVVTQQGGTEVLLQDQGLVYDTKGTTEASMLYNTMSTPRGRQFHITLPDGTKVWLNAASSVKFPVRFGGKDRTVSISGEVYFEVAKDAAKPFFVKLNGNENNMVQVLGTSLNINAYANERSVNTTLIEGKVSVVAAEKNVILLPGKQAQVAGGKIKVTDAAIAGVMAWKNGLFNFAGVPLAEAMRQLERWYDVEVVYPNGIPDVELEGKITRGVTLNELLKGLQELGLRTQLKGTQLLVLTGKP